MVSDDSGETFEGVSGVVWGLGQARCVVGGRWEA